MSAYVNPVVIPNPEAINVEAKIQEMQQALKNGLPWLQVAFGRSWKQFSKNEKGREYAFPAVYYGKGEYFDCMPNDNLKSYCFFSHKDAARPQSDNNENYIPGTWNEWEHKVDLIFWYNQSKLLNIEGEVMFTEDFIQTEPLLAQVRKVLRFLPFFRPEEVFYDADNIFTGYSLDQVSMQFLKHPFGGFRISGKIQFLETDVFGLCP